MRIFCAVRHANDPRQYYGGLWSGNFYPALRRLGHEIVESQVDLAPTSRFMDIPGGFNKDELSFRAKTTEQILTEVFAAHRQKPIRLFLSYFYNSHFDPAGYDELRKAGIPSINFYCNSIYQFDLVADVASKADFAWHAERDAHSLYIAAGANPVWVQMAADPDVYAPCPGLDRSCKACFVGQRYADRDRWMIALIRAQIPVAIYGPGWRNVELRADSSPPMAPESNDYLGRAHPKPATLSSYAAAMRKTVRTMGIRRGVARIAGQLRHRQTSQLLTPMFEPYSKGPVPFQEIAKTFARHEVCLNFSNVWADGCPGSRLVPHVRLRDFEGPMCRTCYLTGQTDEIEEFYRVGKEIDTYRTPEELIDKTKFYLTHPSAAESLRKAGYKRARQCHTWDRRFEELFTKIGINPRG